LATPRVLDSWPTMKCCKATGRKRQRAEIVGIASHQTALHDLRKARHGRFEHLEHRFGLFLQRDLNKDADASAKRVTLRRITPASSNARTRARQGDGERPTCLARSTLVRLPSSCSAARIRISYRWASGRRPGISCCGSLLIRNICRNSRAAAKYSAESAARSPA
jgi:hypothetical protein